MDFVKFSIEILRLVFMQFFLQDVFSSVFWLFVVLCVFIFLARIYRGMDRWR